MWLVLRNDDFAGLNSECFGEFANIVETRAAYVVAALQTPDVIGVKAAALRNLSTGHAPGFPDPPVFLPVYPHRSHCSRRRHLWPPCRGLSCAAIVAQLRSFIKELSDNVLTILDITLIGGVG